MSFLLELCTISEGDNLIYGMRYHEALFPTCYSVTGWNVSQVLLFSSFVDTTRTCRKLFNYLCRNLWDYEELVDCVVIHRVWAYFCHRGCQNVGWHLLFFGRGGGGDLFLEIQLLFWKHFLMWGANKIHFCKWVGKAFYFKSVTPHKILMGEP